MTITKGDLTNRQVRFLVKHEALNLYLKDINNITSRHRHLGAHIDDVDIKVILKEDSWNFIDKTLHWINCISRRWPDLYSLAEVEWDSISAYTKPNTLEIL